MSVWYCVDGNLADKLPVARCIEILQTNQLSSWLEYKQFLHGLHFVDNETGKFRCTCAMFLKQYKCKHCIGTQILYHNFVVDDRAKAQPIGRKRKRGRPANVPSALQSL